MRELLCTSLVLLTVGCASPASWEVRFAPEVSVTSASSVELAILRGGCEGIALYTSVIGRGEAAPLPPSLPPGLLGFAAEARDASCGVIARGCVERTAPLGAGETVVTMLEPASGSACAEGTECSAGRCEPPRDGGQSDLDGGQPDTRDVPSPLDASEADAWLGPSDAAWDADRDATATPSIVSVAAGDYHACVVWSDGAVECWGSDEQGQLGDGPGTPPATAIVSGLSDAEHVSIGYASVCARRRGGEVACWGSGGFGVLGNGGLAASETPVQVMQPGFAPLRGVDEVSVAEGYALARAGGSLFYWGFWGDVAPLDQSRLAVPFHEELTDLRTVTAADFAACVIDASDALLCAGDQARGLLGRDRAAMEPDAGPPRYPIRTTVPPLSAIRVALSISVGCAVTTDHRVACWGTNHDFIIRAVDMGAEIDSPTLLPLTDIRDVGVSEHAACALDGVGVITCWGVNVAGLLGLADTSAVRPPGATTLSLPGRATSLAVATTYACAVVEGRELWCWGRDVCGVVSGTSTSTVDCGLTSVVLTPRRVALRR